VLVQEHTVERPGGRGIEHPHLPHRLVCTDSRGTTASILAVIKTQGSDTKLVGQMQLCYVRVRVDRLWPQWGPTASTTPLWHGSAISTASASTWHGSLGLQQAMATGMHGRGPPLSRSYVIQRMRMLAVTWENATQGKSMFWLHAAVQRGHLAVH
jgi:hypothetical protein